MSRRNMPNWRRVIDPGATNNIELVGPSTDGTADAARKIALISPT
jgi:hypothetical protein